MANVVFLGSSFDAVSGTHSVTTTPELHDLIIIIGANIALGSDTAPTDDNNSGTYSLIVGANKNAGADRLTGYVRTSLITSAVSTIFTRAPGATSGGGIAVYKITGIKVAGLTATPQWGSQANQAATGTPAPALFTGNPPVITNPIIGAVFNATNPATMTPRAGYTEDLDTGSTTPYGIETMHRNSGETSATITWGGTSASAFASLAIEIKAPLPQQFGFSGLRPHPFSPGLAR